MVFVLGLVLGLRLGLGLCLEISGGVKIGEKNTIQRTGSILVIMSIAISLIMKIKVSINSNSKSWSRCQFKSLSVSQPGGWRHFTWSKSWVQSIPWSKSWVCLGFGSGRSWRSTIEISWSIPWVFWR